MSSYLIGHITVRDPEKWAVYVEGVHASLEKYEAAVVFRGKRFQVLAGEHDHQNTVVIRFPDSDRLRQWYESREYQQLIPIRDQAADVVIIGYESS